MSLATPVAISWLFGLTDNLRLKAFTKLQMAFDSNKVGYTKVLINGKILVIAMVRERWIILAKLAPILIGGVLLLLPTTLNAQGVVPCDGPDCNFCSLIQLADNLIDFAVGLLAVLSAIMFAYAGFLMVTASDNEGKLSQANEIFRNVVIGIIITLAAWLIVDTVMKLLIADDQGKAGYTSLGPWNEIDCG